MRRAWVVVLAGLIGCGDSDRLDTSDAGTHPAPDAFAFVEATPASVPQVQSLGGPVVAAPKILPIFFSTGDPVAQASIEDFLAQLAASPYWATTTAEYGVGPLTILPTVVVSDPPPTTDDDLQIYLRSESDGTHAGIPTPDENTIYTVFLPPGAVLTQGGDKSCVAFGGYHFNTLGAQGEDLIYALLPSCTAQAPFTTLDLTTTATSHEFVEAATDPLFGKAKAFFRLDPDHLVWGALPGGELGDMCEFLPRPDPNVRVGPYLVQRTWSNASIAAGHDPCVPLPDEPFIAAVPALTDDVTFGNSMTKGVSVPVGATKAIDVDLYGEAFVDFHVDAIEAGALENQPDNALDLTFDRKVGHNGDKLHLTITRVRNGQFRNGTEIAVRATTIPGVPTALWFGWVSD